MADETEPDWSHAALLTIDVQRDYLSEAPYGIAGTTEVLPALRRLTEAFRSAGRPIVHVVRIYLPDGSNVDISRRSLIAAGASIVRPGTSGMRLAPELTQDRDAPLRADSLLAGELQEIGRNEYVMYKPRWNAFFGTDLSSRLSEWNVDTVVVAGCNYPNCPRGTLFGASERDFRAVAISDAISGWTATAAPELAAIGVHSASTRDAVERLAALPDIYDPDAQSGSRIDRDRPIPGRDTPAAPADDRTAGPHTPSTTLPALLENAATALSGPYRQQATRLLQQVVAEGGAIGWRAPPPTSELNALLETLAAAARRGAAHAAAVTQDDALVGLGYWQRYERETNSLNADVRKVVVKPSLRRHGIARLIMTALIEAATAQSIEALTLDVRADNAAAQHLYESLGFTRYGTLPAFIAVGAARYDKWFYYLALR